MWAALETVDIVRKNRRVRPLPNDWILVPINTSLCCCDLLQDTCNAIAFFENPSPFIFMVLRIIDQRERASVTGSVGKFDATCVVLRVKTCR